LSYYLNFEISILLVIFFLALLVFVIRSRINRP
jgi:hypothetical protein